MKGNEKIISRLNMLLASELAAINQYMVHAEMCSNWGYKKLHDIDQKRAIGEMKHAEKLIARILFLDGHPVVEKLDKVFIGKDVDEQLLFDNKAETEAIKNYNESIRLVRELGDNGTAELLEEILLDEENHLDVIETQQSQITQMDLKNFLVEQTL